MLQKKNQILRPSGRPIKLVYVRFITAAMMFVCVLFLFFKFRANDMEGRAPTLGLLGMSIPFLKQSEQTAPPAPTPDQNIKISLDGTDIAEGIDNDIIIKLQNAITAAPAPVDLSGSAPRILIYHTHTTEAYTQTQKYKYTESSKWRTHDNERNVVAVGENLTKLLREKYGINVIHDITDHEPPKLATSYSRSVVTMEKYKKQYPSITMFIDLHRDAYTPKGENTDYVVMDGERAARMMFVVGTGKGATGSGFSQMPDFASNYALAKRITDYLLLKDDKLMRNIRVKTGRYNQHISNQCLLVEVGHNANTLEEALHSVDYLAEAIAYVAGIGGGSNQGTAATATFLPLTPD